MAGCCVRGWERWAAGLLAEAPADTAAMPCSLALSHLHGNVIQFISLLIAGYMKRNNKSTAKKENKSVFRFMYILYLH